MLSDYVNNEKIFEMVREEISDSGLTVAIDAKYFSGEFINRDCLIVLKPDSYFNTHRFAQPPQMCDNCLMYDQEVSGSCNKITLIELKNTKDKDQIKPSTVTGKFDAALTYLVQGIIIDELGVGLSVPEFKMDAFLVTPFMDSAQNKQMLLDLYINRPSMSFHGIKIMIKPVGTSFSIQ